jgi:hypothetical protein
VSARVVEGVELRVCASPANAEHKLAAGVTLEINLIHASDGRAVVHLDLETARELRAGITRALKAAGGGE